MKTAKGVLLDLHNDVRCKQVKAILKHAVWGAVLEAIGPYLGKGY